MAYFDNNASQQFHTVDYDLKREQRAVKHRKLGDRNNVTTCRSPTRDLDTRWIKGELHRKRQEEFSKRRPVGCDMTALLSTRVRHNFTREEEWVTQTSMSLIQPFTDRQRITSVKQAITTSSLNNGKGPGLKHKAADVLSSLQQRDKAKNERAFLRDITQLKNNQRTLHAASAQTELGVTTVKDVDVVQLANYLEEALYREEALKKKLATLQKSATTLLRSTELLWKTRCDEDLLKSKIKALEAQLQLCMKRVPQDGVKKVILTMEKQKEEYEHKALEAIQKATQENTEAQSKMENLQEELQATQAEAARWHKLCDELRESSSLLRQSQDVCTDQLLQLQNQLERSREQEESLRTLCESLQLKGAELHSSMILLEQDNQTLREELEDLTVQSRVSWNNITEAHKHEPVPDQLPKTDNHRDEQLCHAEQRLSLKENECIELKAELETLEQECYSYRSTPGAGTLWRLPRRELYLTPRDHTSSLAGSARAFLLRRPSSDEERTFNERLSSCASTQEVLHLLRLSPPLSGTVAASVLHQLADVESVGVGGLREPVPLSDPVLGELCERLGRDLAELEDEVLVRALIDCARLGLNPHDHLAARLVLESQERLDSGHLCVDNLCGLAHALFVLQGPDSGTLAQAMQQLQGQDLATWSMQELTTVYSVLAGGLARDGRYQDLLNQMNIRAIGLAFRMDHVVVSEVLGVLVTLGQTQVLTLVIALCKQAVRHVPRFTDMQLATVLSALMHYGHGDQFLIQALEHHVPKMAFTADPETVTVAMQYFAQRRILSPAVFDAVAESLVDRADEYTVEQVCRQIVALATMGYAPKEASRLFRTVESVLSSRLSQFQPRVLLELLHACTLLQRYPLNYTSRIFSPHFVLELQEEGSGMNRMVLAQLTQLYMSMKLECPFFNDQWILPKLRVKSFLSSGSMLETRVNFELCCAVKTALVDLLGAPFYFASRVLTPYCYTLDVEIKLDAEGYVLPARDVEDVYKRIALCVDGPLRFAANAKQLLGKEAIKQRHLRILGYEVVQIPYYEFEMLKSKKEKVEYLHKKIFQQSW